jgi:phosphatidylserine/phosphatidylglycerophosphate/cardiolipin synthase-like enzyme
MKHAGIKLPVERDSLHSRLVIIDSREVLVSSADLDFTQMDLEFNAGIWTRDPDVVAEAIQYFDNLLGLSQTG